MWHSFATLMETWTGEERKVSAERRAWLRQPLQNGDQVLNYAKRVSALWTGSEH